MEGSATSFRLQNLSKFEKQLNILRSVLQENSKYHICTQSDEITVPSVPEFLLGPVSTSKSSEFSNANEAKLLRLSTINSALTCLELAEKICQCGNENDELARDKKSHYYMETKLGIFLTDYHVTMCILDSLICRGKFIVHTASNTFLKYCLKFPETLLKHDLFSKNISRMCLDNRAMFMDLLALLTKVLRKQIKQKDDKFLFSVTETHQSYFDILSVLIRNFCDFVLDNSTVNKHLGLNSSFKMLTEIEIYSKWKSCFQILKLCNLMTCIFSKHSSSLESPYAGEREQCIENELSGKCYNLFLEVERACSHFTNLEVISAISISNYSCKYALKILKLNLEDTQNSNKSFETATLIMDFFLESDTEQLFQFKQANSNEKNTYSSIFKSEIKDENFVSGMMSRFRMWLIILLRSCLLVADAACDQYHHKVIESLKRLSTYLSSSYFDEKQDADTVLNMDRSLLNVFIDEDDQLFEAMMYLFKIYNALLHRNHTNLPQVLKTLGLLQWMADDIFRREVATLQYYNRKIDNVSEKVKIC